MWQLVILHARDCVVLPESWWYLVSSWLPRSVALTTFVSHFLEIAPRLTSAKRKGPRRKTGKPQLRRYSVSDGPPTISAVVTFQDSSSPAHSSNDHETTDLTQTKLFSPAHTKPTPCQARSL